MMSDKADGYDWEGLNSYEDSELNDTIHLLELIEIDYQGARKQLESLGRILAEREAIVNRRIQNAKISSRAGGCLCLKSYQDRTIVNRLGTAMLGVPQQECAIPKLVRLEIHCLDGFQVSARGTKVERWESMKAKSLFQYLMTKPRKPVAKEVLMEALWPNCEPRVASNNLKAAMHGLRQTFSNLLDMEQSFPFVVFTQGTYQINPEILLWLDVEQFELHWETGRRLQAEGKEDEAMREFKLAKELYKEEYMVDDPYEDWTLLRREALQDMYLYILGALADYHLKNTDYESCITYSLKILDKDSCREDAYRRIMRCYHRLGLRNRALQWYEICRKTIKAELDTTPDKETADLYQQLLDNKPI